MRDLEFGEMVFFGPGPENLEYLAFKPDGRIFVQGRPAGSDFEVVTALKAWTEKCAILNKNPMGGKNESGD